MNQQARFVVITKVKVKPGQAKAVKELFINTNPKLVAGEEDWLDAVFTADLELNEVTVLAFWKSSDSYKAFSATDAFKGVMAQFSPYFLGPPSVQLCPIHFGMDTKSQWSFEA